MTKNYNITVRASNVADLHRAVAAIADDLGEIVGVHDDADVDHLTEREMEGIALNPAAEPARVQITARPACTCAPAPMRFWLVEEDTAEPIDPRQIPAMDNEPQHPMAFTVGAFAATAEDALALAERYQDGDIEPWPIMFEDGIARGVIGP